MNTASRMESTSFPMAVQVSKAVADDTGAADIFQPLGERNIKGKGLMTTYLLKVSLLAAVHTSLCASMLIGRHNTGKLVPKLRKPISVPLEER